MSDFLDEYLAEDTVEPVKKTDFIDQYLAEGSQPEAPAIRPQDKAAQKQANWNEYIDEQAGKPVTFKTKDGKSVPFTVKGEPEERNFAGNMGESFSRGNENFWRNIGESLNAMGVTDANTMYDKWDTYNRAQEEGDPVTADNWFSKQFHMVSEMAPGLIAGSIASRASPGLSLGMWAMQGTGDMYRNLINDGVDRKTALAVSIPLGIVYGKIEQLQAGQAGLTKPLKAKLNDTVKKLSNNATKRILAKYGTNVLKEASEEGLQQIVQEMANYIGKGASDLTSDTNFMNTEFDKEHFGQSAKNIAESFYQSIVPMAIVSIPGHAWNGRRYLKKLDAVKKGNANRQNQPIQPPPEDTGARSNLQDINPSFDEFMPDVDNTPEPAEEAEPEVIGYDEAGNPFYGQAPAFSSRRDFPSTPNDVTVGVDEPAPDVAKAIMADPTTDTADKMLDEFLEKGTVAGQVPGQKQFTVPEPPKIDVPPSADNIYMRMPMERVQQDAENGVLAAKEALKQRQGEVQTVQAPVKAQTFEEFAKEYRDNFEKMNQYTPDQVGRNHYAEKMAAMEEANPDWVAQIENERTAPATRMATEQDMLAKLEKNQKEKALKDGNEPTDKQSAREEAKNYMRAYVKRGDSLESFFHFQGRSEPNMASVQLSGGYYFAVGQKNGKKLGSKQMVVIMNHGNKNEAIHLFNIKDIYDELKKEQESGQTKTEPAPEVKTQKTQKAKTIERPAKEPWQMTKDEYLDAVQNNTVKKENEFGNASHERLVWKAVQEGKPVPAEVLKDYPELTKKPLIFNGSIGKNSNGNEIFKDDKGARYYVARGLRVTQPVQVIPGKGVSIDSAELLYQKNRKEFLTVEELADQDKAKAIIDEAKAKNAEDNKPENVKKRMDESMVKRAKKELEAGTITQEQHDNIIEKHEAKPVIQSPVANLSPEKQAKLKELQDKLRKQTMGRTSMGLDPEALVTAAQMAQLYAEGGIKTFKQFAQVVKADMADAWNNVKVYLHSAWQAAGSSNTELDDVSRTDASKIIAEIDNSGLEKTPINATNNSGGNENAVQPEKRSVALDEAGMDEGQPAGTPAEAIKNTGETVGDAGNSGSVSGGNVVQGGKGRGNKRPGGRNSPKRPVSDGSGSPGTDSADIRAGVGEDKESREVRTGKDIDPQDNLRIQPDDEIVPNGKISRIKANIAAIKLLKKLESEDRLPTADEKRKLMQFSGWGDTFQVFGETNKEDYGYYIDRDPPYWMSDETRKSLENWKKQYGEYYKALHPDHGGLMTAEQFQSAKESSLNAHYTSREVINSMWAIVQRLGFKGGTAVEPSAGIGSFIGLTPDSYAGKLHWIGVELDDITGRILKKLYPASDIQITGFEKSKRTTNNSADLVISNFPFGDYDVADISNPDYDGWSIHNYFTARSIDVVKPGGLVVAITSHHTMDASSGRKMREYLAGKADLIGAVRLPFTAFKSNAGTEVVTDILVFRKKTPGFNSTNRFASTIPVDFDGQNVQINEYFVAHPDMVLGKQAMSGKMNVGKDKDGNAIKSYNVEPDNSNPLPLQIAKAAMNMPENIMESDTAEEAPAPSVIIEGIKPDSYTVKEGKVFKVDSQGVAHEPEWAKQAAQVKKAKAIIEIRDTLRKQIDIENNEEVSDEDVEANRKELNKLYDEFFKKYGGLNNKSNDLLDDDPEWPLVASLEDIERKPIETEYKSGENKGQKYIKFEDSYSKGLPLKQRFVFHREIPGKAESLEDAVSLSLSYKGDVLTDYVARLLNMSPEEAKKQMIEKGLAFENPATGLMESPEDYLSGTVREKLAQAKKAAEQDKRFQVNVDALEKVQPAPLTLDKIYFRIGTNWITSAQIERFLVNVLDVRAKVTFTRAMDQTSWSIDVSDGRSVKNMETFGVKYGHRNDKGEIVSEVGIISGSDIVGDALNLKMPEAKWTEKDKDSVTTCTDPVASVLAQEKLQKIQDEFRKWVSANPREAKEVEDTYNRIMNGITPPKTRTPDIKTFPGANPNIELRDWQKRVAVRAVRQSLLIAHSVGTGKTYSLQTIAMEMRRLKTATKPMIVVQNSTLGQFARSFKRLYPTANILVGTEKSISAKNRNAFIAKATTGEWDAVIIPQSFFESIRNDPVREQGYVRERISELEDMIMEAEMEAGNRGDIDFENTRKLKSTTGKALAKVLKRYRARLDRSIQEMNKNKDNLIYFEKMGVDALLVDEAHNYKRGDFYTKMNGVKGIDTNGSDRSLDFLMKTMWINSKTPGKNVILATGTPISNTLAEMWTMLRYVRPDVLEKFGVSTFDDFVGSFANTKTDTEETPGGEFRKVTRLAKYVNGPELSTMWRTGTDVYVLDRKDLPGVPKVKGGQPTEIVIDRPSMIGDFVNMIREWRAWWEELPGKDKVEWNYVPILQFTLARKAAIDLRLVDPSLPDIKDSKVNRIISEAFSRWKDSKENNGTQLIFSNISVSHDSSKKWLNEEEQIPNPLYGIPEFNIFEDMRDKLIKMGVPKDEIAIISSDMGKEKRDSTAELIKAGKVRIAFGTTETMGTGLNIQDNIIAIHHADPMFRPMDFEQRNGRGVRQGNRNSEIEILVYGVRNTLDSTLYQLMLIKQKFITQAMMSEQLAREFDDPADDSTIGFQTMAAAFSGNPMLKEKFGLENEIRKLDNMEQEHSSTKRSSREKLIDIEERERTFNIGLDKFRKTVEKIKSVFPDKKISNVTINDKTVTGDDAAKFLAENIEGVFAKMDKELDRMFKAGILEERYKDSIKVKDNIWRRTESPLNKESLFVTINGIMFKLDFNENIEINALANKELKTERTGRWEMLSNEPYFTWSSKEPWQHGEYTPSGNASSGQGFITALKLSLDKYAVNEEAVNDALRRFTTSKEDLNANINAPFEMGTRLADLKIRLEDINKKLAAEGEQAGGDKNENKKSFLEKYPDLAYLTRLVSHPRAEAVKSALVRKEMEEQAKEYFIYNKKENKYIKVSGKGKKKSVISKFKMPGYESYNFFIYNHDGSWGIAEENTGMVMRSGADSRQKAIDEVTKWFNEYGKERFEEVFNDKSQGLVSPRLAAIRWLENKDAEKFAPGAKIEWMSDGVSMAGTVKEIKNGMVYAETDSGELQAVDMSKAKLLEETGKKPERQTTENVSSMPITVQQANAQIRRLATQIGGTVTGLLGKVGSKVTLKLKNGFTITIEAMDSLKDNDGKTAGGFIEKTPEGYRIGYSVKDGRLTTIPHEAVGHVAWNALSDRERAELHKFLGTANTEQAVEKLATMWTQKPEGIKGMAYLAWTRFRRMVENIGRIFGVQINEGRRLAEDVVSGRTMERAGAQEGRAYQIPLSQLNNQEKNDYLSWALQLNDYKSGKIDKSKSLTVGHTPKVFNMLGADNLPITISSDIIEKATKGLHEVPFSELYKLYEVIRDPIAVFQSMDEPNGLVAMTEMKEGDKTVVVAVHLNYQEAWHEVNSIRSVYGKNEDNIFIQWIKDGALRYVNNKKILAWSRSRGLQLPKESTKEGSRHKLITEDDVFKLPSEKQFQTLEDNGNKIMRYAERMAEDLKDSDPELAKRILANPEVYYQPMSFKDTQDFLSGLSDAKLDEVISRYQTVNLKKNDRNILPAALIEKANRQYKHGDDSAFATVDAANVFHGAGQMLVQARLARNTDPVFVESIIEKEVEKAGRKLTHEQKKDLTDKIRKEFEARDRMHDAEDAWEKDFENKDKAEAVDKARKEYEKYSLETFDKIKEVTPKSLSDIFVTALQGNLLSPISQIANISGNLSIMPLLYSSQHGAALFDAGISLVMGKKRTVLNPWTGNMAGLKYAGRGLKQATKQLFQGNPTDYTLGDQIRGFSPLRAWVQGFTGKNMPVNEKGVVPLTDRAKKLIEAFLGTTSEPMLRMLSFGDLPFKGFAYGRAIAEIGRMKGLSGRDLERFIEFPDSESMEKAMQQAKIAVFQEDNKMATIIQHGMRELRETPVVGGVAHFAAKGVLPYVKTPANLAWEGLQFLSPELSMIRSIYFATQGKQRDSLIALGKAMTGQAILTGAAYLIANGLVTPPPDKEKKKRELEYATMPPGSINMSGLARLMSGEDPTWRAGDDVRSYSRLGFAGMIIQVMATRERKAREEWAKTGNYSKYSGGSLQLAGEALPAVLTMTSVKGTNDFLSALMDNKMDKWFASYFKAVSSVALPNTLSALNRISMDSIPEASGDSLGEAMTNSMKTKLWMYQNLPSKRDILGRPIRSTPEGSTAWYHQLFDITKGQSIPEDPVSRMIWEVFVKTGYDGESIPPVPDQTIRTARGAAKLTDKQYERFLELVGQERIRMLSKISPDMSPAGKLRIFKKIYERSLEVAKSRFIREMSGQVVLVKKKAARGEV